MPRRVSLGMLVRVLGVIAIVGGVVVGGIGVLYAVRGHTARVKQTLTATSIAPSARGKARLSLRGAQRGKFTVIATHLKGGKPYDVIVAGVKVATMVTSSGGSGHAVFSRRPGTNALLLGFDPRGAQVLVRDEEDGDDVLVGDIPDDDPTAIACCITEADDDGGETECEDMTTDECTAAGGTAQTTGSCLPDPCGTATGQTVVCCTNATEDDESDAECEDAATEADCAAAGGTVVQATSCDPNPCQATPAANEVACCITQTDTAGQTETECEVVTAEACTAVGGTAPGGATCNLDPCNIGTP